MRLIPIVLLSIIASGCATMPEAECDGTDWYAMGLEDGLRGQMSSNVSKRAAACATAGAIPDRARYQAGHTAGLNDYCTVENGIQAGKTGRSYKDVCPDAQEGEFLAGYYLGAISLMRR